MPNSSCVSPDRAVKDNRRSSIRPAHIDPRAMRFALEASVQARAALPRIDALAIRLALGEAGSKFIDRSQRQFRLMKEGELFSPTTDFVSPV
jgi:hypothetical protein